MLVRVKFWGGRSIVCNELEVLWSFGRSGRGSWEALLRKVRGVFQSGLGLRNWTYTTCLKGWKFVVEMKTWWGRVKHRKRVEGSLGWSVNQIGQIGIHFVQWWWEGEEVFVDLSWKEGLPRGVGSFGGEAL